MQIHTGTGEQTFEVNILQTNCYIMKRSRLQMINYHLCLCWSI